MTCCAVGAIALAGCDDGESASEPATTTTTRPLAERAADWQLAFVSEQRTREAQSSSILLSDSAEGTGGTKELTKTERVDEALAWAPSGQVLVFASDREGPDFDVWQVSAEGTDLRNLTAASTANEGAPVFSPDGSTIAYFSDGAGDFDVWLMDADGQNQRRLFDAPGDVSTPAWSPDGQRIAVTVTPPGTAGSSDIFVVDVASGTATNVTEGTGQNDGPQWSPDGERIAFSGQRDGDTAAEIYTMAPDGSDAQRLTEAKGPDRDPVWSPDGEQIAFISTRDAIDGLDVINEEIYVMDADGSNPKNLTTSPNAIDRFPRWSPDGKFLAFSGTFNDNTEILVMNANGSGITNVSKSFPADTWPAWRPRPDAAGGTAADADER